MSIIINFQPIGKKIHIQKGQSLLQAAQSAGIGLSAICGGQKACGSCLVRIVGVSLANPPSEIEIDLISPEKRASGFRLACQTVVAESTVVEIPPESLTALQRTQIEGDEKNVEFDPCISFYDIEFSASEQKDLRSDWEKIRQVLQKKGISDPQVSSLTVLKQLPHILRENNWSVRVVLSENQVSAILPPNSAILGLAVDVGTTKIAGYLVDLSTGVTLAQNGAMNPQMSYGEDIMTRISYLMDADQKDDLQNLIINTISQMAEALCQQAEKNLTPFQIIDTVLVGNTAMHHILLGLPVKQLGVSPFLSAVSTQVDILASEIGLKVSESSRVHFFPNIAGFVGADHIAMLLSAGINDIEKTTLFIDIGTNTEITLFTGVRSIACSTASGPAFEGAHIKDGMRAADGAIERVRIDETGINYQTINDKKPVGICGSGILDAIAQMVNSGVINPQGGFNADHPLVRKGDKGPELVLANAEKTKHQQDIIINRKDVSEIQLAKGAIRAGIELLLNAAEIRWQDVEKVIIAGAFGTFIDVKSAETIGLFPSLKEVKVKQIGNAAGIGAKMALLSRQKRKEATQIADSIEYLELSTHAEFTSEFAKAMIFSN